jgi:hypothetical protein
MTRLTRLQAIRGHWRFCVEPGHGSFVGPCGRVRANCSHSMVTMIQEWRYIPNQSLEFVGRRLAVGCCAGVKSLFVVSR